MSEALEKFKSTYKPKEGYSFIIGCDPIDNNKLTVHVYKKVTIMEKVRGSDVLVESIADTSILNGKATYEEFVKLIGEYIDAR